MRVKPEFWFETEKQRIRFIEATKTKDCDLYYDQNEYINTFYWGSTPQNTGYWSQFCAVDGLYEKEIGPKQYNEIWQLLIMAGHVSPEPFTDDEYEEIFV